MERNKKTASKKLPAIPEKLYFTIGEAADLCHLKNHVLRYWEQVFPALSPKKKRGNRRYYTKEEILLIREIRELLYFQGFTITGAQKVLKTKTETASARHETQDVMSELIDELNQVLVTLE